MSSSVTYCTLYSITKSIKSFLTVYRRWGRLLQYKKSVNYYILCCLSRSTITFHFCSLWSLPPEPGGRTSVRWRASTTDLPHSWLRRVSFYKKVWTTSNINLKWPCHEILYFMTKTQISRVGFWLSTYILILLYINCTIRRLACEFNFEKVIQIDFLLNWFCATVCMSFIPEHNVHFVRLASLSMTWRVRFVKYCNKERLVSSISKNCTTVQCASQLKHVHLL